MKLTFSKILAIVTLILCSSISAYNQDKLEVLYSKEVRHETVNNQEVGTYWGDVQIKKGDIFMYMDSIRQINKETWAYDNIIVQQGDSLSLFGDSMFYDDLKSKLYLYGDVVINKNESSLFTNFLEYNLDTKIGFYKNEGLLTNLKTFLSSKLGRYYAATDDILFKDSVYVEDPDFTLKADSLWFNQTTRIITFNGPTIIKFQDSYVYCEAGYYDINTGEALFTQNAQYTGENNRSIADSDSILYNQKTGEIQLKGNAFYRSDSLQAKADKLFYYEKEQYVKLITDGDFKSVDMSAKGDYLEYYINSRKFKTNERATIINGGSIISADYYDMDNTVGEGIITGNVVFHDTINKTILWSDTTLVTDNSNNLRSYGDRPILMNYSDEDTLWITADIFLSFTTIADEWQRENKTQIVVEEDALFDLDDNVELDTLSLSSSNEDLDRISNSQLESLTASIDTTKRHTIDLDSTTIRLDSLITSTTLPDSIHSTEADSSIIDTLIESRIIQGLGNVRIYNKSLQGVCDSLTYIEEDSLFYLDNNPILWSDSTQITGDSIRMMMSDNRPTRFDVIDNVFMINTADGYFFSQIAGKKGEGTMAENKLSELWVRGAVKTIFYIINDDDEYVGVNKHDASRLKAEFVEGKLENIIYYDKPEGEMLPMRGTNHNALLLENFNYQTEKRPNSPEKLRPGLPASLLDTISALPPKIVEETEENLDTPDETSVENETDSTIEK